MHEAEFSRLSSRRSQAFLTIQRSVTPQWLHSRLRRMRLSALIFPSFLSNASSLLLSMLADSLWQYDIQKLDKTSSATLRYIVDGAEDLALPKTPPQIAKDSQLKVLESHLRRPCVKACAAMPHSDDRLADCVTSNYYSLAHPHNQMHGFALTML